jgi:transmembrane sensor
MENTREQEKDDILILIAGYLEGIADSEERAELEKWIEASSENRKYFNQVKEIWDAAGNGKDLNLTDPHEAWQKVEIRGKGLMPEKTSHINWQRIAAILLLPFIISTLTLLYLNSKKSISPGEPVYNEIFAAYGTRSALKLVDSSRVWLNSGSSLSYPDRFSGPSRIVYLKGEAYFEVKSDENHPFIVKTPTFEVHAKGTRFNVMDYDKNPVTEVTLVSGKVEIERNDNGNTGKLIAVLKPNQHLNYNKNTMVHDIQNEDAYKHYAWKDGKMIFRNEPLSEVVKKISQVFNVDIKMQGEELQNCRYRATFQDESLQEVLKLLKLSSPVDYIETPRTPLPDGSFSRKEIIIFPAKHR